MKFLQIFAKWRNFTLDYPNSYGHLYFVARSRSKRQARSFHEISVFDFVKERLSNEDQFLCSLDASISTSIKNVQRAFLSKFLHFFLESENKSTASLIFYFEDYSFDNKTIFIDLSQFFFTRIVKDIGKSVIEKFEGTVHCDGKFFFFPSSK